MSTLVPGSLHRALAGLLALEGPLAFLRRPGAWWWIALGLGAALRALFVGFTGGTYDVGLWEGFGRDVGSDGLFQLYHRERRFNHPPPIGLAAAGCFRLPDSLGIPFALVWRLPFALLDAASAALLFRLCGERPERYLVTAIYWLCPLALVYSAYHGNSDSAIGFCLLAAVYCFSRGSPLAAGAVMGASSWIKLPGLLAIPALGLALPTWKARALFGVAAACVALLGYAPALAIDPGIVADRVLGYGGVLIRTTEGVYVWGIPPFYPLLRSLPEAWQPAIRAALAWHAGNTRELCLGLVVLVAFARRGERDVRGLARTVTLCCAVLYGLSSYWSFQYLAWALPLWLLAGIDFALPALALGSLYVYGLYAWLTGHPLLLGSWDFLGRPVWPRWLEWSRDANYLFFLATALAAGALASVRTGRELRRRLPARSSQPIR